MRVAILTLSLHTNYGGILQAYALQTILSEMGCEVDVLCKNEKPVVPWTKRLVRIYKRYVLGHKSVDVSIRRRYMKMLRKRKYTEAFIKKKVNRRVISSLTEINQSEYDCYVVGSDQVWRPMYFKMWYGDIRGAFLDFTAGWNVKRIAYAASFGTSDWEYSIEESMDCSRLLSRFDSVSVREKCAIMQCERYLRRTGSVHVLDPTMLLSRESYIALTDGVKKSEGNMMCYILDNDERTDSIIYSVSEQMGLKPFMAGVAVDSKNDVVQPPVEEWLAGFRDAEFVVTDSFHACVFSILFNKPFIVIGNEKRGNARFTSLLSMFGLEDRLVSGCDCDSLCDIDWGEVNTMLESYRIFSRLFLKSSLYGEYSC